MNLLSRSKILSFRKNIKVFNRHVQNTFIAQMFEKKNYVSQCHLWILIFYDYTYL